MSAQQLDGKVFCSSKVGNGQQKRSSCMHGSLHQMVTWLVYDACDPPSSRFSFRISESFSGVGAVYISMAVYVTAIYTCLHPNFAFNIVFFLFFGWKRAIFRE